MTEKILVVDDDRDICDILEFNIKSEGFHVSCAYSAEEALEKLSDDSYSLILLDVMMGGMSGFKMAERLRSENNQIPIIFLTARDTENDMLTGFSVGGDDYISKPFSIKEVIARIKAVFKRTKFQAEERAMPENRLSFNQLLIDLDMKEVTVKGERISLTKTEFEILALLAQKPDRLFSREDIIETVWPEMTYVTERTVDVHITRLRKKLGTYSGVIVNRSGYGYRFDTAVVP
ncbi:MAG: response regulator transcription factor [Porphyromonas sp.]|nr:response regulator transcription factor [Porphyromonas sp.]